MFHTINSLSVQNGENPSVVESASVAPMPVGMSNGCENYPESNTSMYPESLTSFPMMWSPERDTIMEAFGSGGSTWESHSKQNSVTPTTGSYDPSHAMHERALPPAACHSGPISLSSRDMHSKDSRFPVASTIESSSCTGSRVHPSHFINGESCNASGWGRPVAPIHPVHTHDGTGHRFNHPNTNNYFTDCGSEPVNNNPLNGIAMPMSSSGTTEPPSACAPSRVGKTHAAAGNTDLVPASDGKHVHVCYKCGVAGHHPAVCQVDVKYMMCGVHGRRRSEKNLFYDEATGRYQCRAQFQCKTSDRRGTAAPRDYRSGGGRNPTNNRHNTASSAPSGRSVSPTDSDITTLVPVRRDFAPGHRGSAKSPFHGIPYVGIAMVPHPSWYPHPWGPSVVPVPVGPGGMPGAALPFVIPSANSPLIGGSDVRPRNGAPITYFPAMYPFSVMPSPSNKN